MLDVVAAEKRSTRLHTSKGIGTENTQHQYLTSTSQHHHPSSSFIGNLLFRRNVRMILLERNSDASRVSNDNIPTDNFQSLIMAWCRRVFVCLCGWICVRQLKHVFVYSHYSRNCFLWFTHKVLRFFLLLALCVRLLSLLRPLLLFTLDGISEYRWSIYIHTGITMMRMRIRATCLTLDECLERKMCEEQITSFS